MPKTVRCISGKFGLTEVAIPAHFIEPFKHGEERALPDDIAADLLCNPHFEEVSSVAPAPAKPDVTNAASDVSK